MDQSVEEQTVDIVPPTVDTLSPSNPQSVDNSQDIVVERTNPDTGVNEETMRFSVMPPKQEAPTVPSEASTPQSLPHQPEPTQVKWVNPNPGGRPCKYCQDKPRYQEATEEYIKRHRDGAKPTIPYIEELAMELGVDDGTVVIWAGKPSKDDKSGEEYEHPEFHAAYLMLKTLQKFRLKQRALGRYNPHGALYLLNSDHGVMQTNKQVHTGDVKEPLQIILTEERKLPDA